MLLKKKKNDTKQKKKKNNTNSFSEQLDERRLQRASMGVEEGAR